MKKIIVFWMVLCLSYMSMIAQTLVTSTGFGVYYTPSMTEKDVAGGRTWVAEKITIGMDGDGKGYYHFDVGMDQGGRIIHSYSEDDVEIVRPDVWQYYDVPDEERETLMEFYRATDGDNWTHNEGWGSDLPVSQWYGIETNSYSIPGCDLPQAHVTSLLLPNNNLTGNLPQCLLKLTKLRTLAIQDNNLSGEFPENPLSELMERSYRDGVCLLHLSGNHFGPTIPEWVQQHELFQHFWPEFILQDGMDASILETVRIPAPDINFIDLDGNRHTSPKEYSNNRLTILFNWATWCPFTPNLMRRLIPAYEKYHNVGLNIIGMVDIRTNENNGSDTREAVETYIEENNIRWPNVSAFSDNKGEFCWDNQLFFLKWWAYGVPSVTAINSEGEIIFQSHFYNNYLELIPLIEEMFGPIDPIDYYTSTDYSHDGEVRQLQQATIGKGIDIVFMGEPFVDKDMEPGGKYEKKMNSALEQFFAYEPYKSLRNRFNVYEVKVVSPNEALAADARTALNTTGDIFEYAQKAIGADADQMMVCVFYNSEGSFCRSYTNMYEDGSFIAFIKDAVGPVLNHEVGHGFGLLDEYVEGNYQDLTMPEEKKIELDEKYEKYGWGANVDWRNDASTVRWAKFLKDERYVDAELGLFEGSGLYGYGAYRPTENSMMRYNNAPFNAPSRESIYKRIMKLSEGDDWEYDYETFVEFDLSTHPYGGLAKLRKIQEQKEESQQDPRRVTIPQTNDKHVKPTFIKGTWRDANEKVERK